MKTKINTKITPLIPSQRLQNLADKIGSPNLAKGTHLGITPDLSDLRPEDILSLFHQGKLNEKDTMFWLGVLAVGAEERAKKQEELATMDELTNVYNRRAFVDTLSKELSRLRSKHLQIKRLLSEPMSLSLMMLDIDYFKQINDKWGHLAGDAVLRALADILKKQVRGADMVFRYGGEEFAILLPDTETEVVGEAAKRISRAIGNSRFVINKKSGKSVGITVSIGITSIEGAQLADVQVTDMIIPRLIAQADEALYWGKGAGRNQVVVWSKKLKRKMRK